MKILLVQWLSTFILLCFISAITIILHNLATQTHWERLFPCWFSQAGYETSSFCYVFFCRSNLMGTKFTVYDSGLNPMKSTTSLEASNLRQELAAICYVSWSKCTLTPNSTLLYLGRHMLTITYM